MTDRESLDETRMPISGHLEELRKRILLSVIALAVGIASSLALTDPVLGWLQRPLGQGLYFFTPAEAFWTHLKVAFFMGLVFSFPVALYHLWRFVAPGFYRRERRYALLFVLLSVIFFSLGIAFCAYIALPFALKFLLGFGMDRGMEPLISVGRYVDFTLKFYFAFGLVFQLPLAITLASKMGILTPQFLARYRKYAFLINAVVAATLTPTSDIFNMMLMLVPLTLLYEVGILGARVFGSKKPYAAGEAQRHAGAT